MLLLHQLEALATRQRQITETGSLTEAPPVIETRDRVMANLVAVEHALEPVRAALAEHRTALAHLPDFEQLTEHHREASELVSSILATDAQSMDALREAEDARRFAAKSVEQGESTLAAYRRVVAPPLTGATIVNQKG
jgi:hypothetical protein